MTSPNCPTLSTVSIVMLAVGVVLTLVSIIPWIIYFVKRRRDKQKSRPMAPRVGRGCDDASGEYIDFQDDCRYETMVHVPKGKSVSRYGPSSKSKDAMDETFDGSRMPQKNAPKPPNQPPKSIVLSVKRNDGLTESGNNIYEDYSHDDSDKKQGGGVMNKLAGRISRTLERTNDIRRGLTMSGTHKAMPKRNTMR